MTSGLHRSPVLMFIRARRLPLLAGVERNASAKSTPEMLSQALLNTRAWNPETPEEPIAVSARQGDGVLNPDMPGEEPKLSRALWTLGARASRRPRR